MKGSTPPVLEVEGKCSRCLGSTCCTYTTEALSTPTGKADFEHMLWQISHAGVEIYKDTDGWYLLIRGSCEHLQASGGCGIYDQRPQVCRDYTNDWCEFDEPAEKHFIHHFRNYAELLTYCQGRFKTWKR